MILFSTLLNISDTMTPENFMQLVIDWNKSSKYSENIVPGVEWHQERSAHFGDARLSMDILYYREKSILAVRHRKITSSEIHTITWDTDFVANFADRRIAIRLDRTYSEDALRFNGAFSTPHFITMLISRGFLSPDMNLPISRDPLMISDQDSHHLSGVFRNEVHYQLPLVYVSKTADNEYPVEISWLASRLKGAAHVMAETDIADCQGLRLLSQESSEEFGAVRIYYPSEGIPRKRFRFRSSTGPAKDRLEKVIRHVVQYKNAQRIDPLYTFVGVNGAILQQMLSNQHSLLAATENARNLAEAELKDLYDSFDEEIETLKKQVDQLMRDNRTLTYENTRLQAKIASDEGSPLLFRGEEKDFYPDELREVIMDILSDALRNVEHGTRREDILEDILQSNTYMGLPDQKKQKVKNLFKGYKNLSNSMRQELAQLGITIHEDGKHYKLFYQDDARYMVTIPKTPSDGRSGNNTAALVNKIML